MELPVHMLSKWGVAIAAGALYVFGVYGWFGRDYDGSLIQLAAGALGVMFAMSVVVLMLTRQPIWTTGLFVFVGICTGVIIDVGRDVMMHRPERNLFPVEIALLTIIGAPGFMAATMVYLAMGWIRRRKPSM
jgi:hypothetical protein